MTATGPTQATPVTLPREAEVIAFLRANPTFLDQHPELLSQLAIPHGSGDAVSLLERQVAVLREDNARLKQQFEQLVGHARENERLNGRIHALALRLMNAAGPRAVFAALDGNLREQFGADRVASLVFAEPAFIEGAEVPQFAGREAPARAAFSDMLGAARSVCGVIAPAQAEALFGSTTPVGSAVLMPLIGAGWDGVLAIASEDENRYQADMGTEFLNYLKDIVALVIDPWVKRAAAR
ncbi:MAG: DUF484 family protein [Gammaproteobacteria bacterium]